MVDGTMDWHAYKVVIEPLSEEDGGGFLATVPELPGCMSDGETWAEALVNVEDAIGCWIEAAREMGRTCPEPQLYRHE
jgi:antitoxin HicB